MIIVLFVSLIVLGLVASISVVFYVLNKDSSSYLPDFRHFTSPPVKRYQSIDSKGLENSLAFEKMAKRNEEILISKGVKKEKIRFVGMPMFRYNLKLNIVNPPIKLMIPLKENGLFDNSQPPIDLSPELTKDNVIVSVNNYSQEGLNWEELVKEINNSLNGYVFCLIYENEEYHYEVDTPRVRFIDLDERIKYYMCSQETM